MKRALLTLAGAAGLLSLTQLSLVTAASAQVASLAATKGGATAQIGNTIAKVVSTRTDLQMRTQALGGTQQYIPMVNAGEIDFGLSNLPQYTMAVTGTGLSEGTKYENLRIAANMMVFRTGPIVRIDDNINSLAELKGKRLPYGFKAAPLFAFIGDAILANAGLTIKDGKAVPVVALRQHWDIFKEGKIDYVIAAVGTGVLTEMNASIPGGIKYLSMDASDEAVKRTLAIFPGSYLAEVQPAKPLVGVLQPVNVFHYDYLIWTHKGASDEVVYKVVKALYDNEQDLKEAGPLWRSHASKTMGKDHGLDYHPAAVKFYKEAGLR
tara:strand:+ start:193 stop:1161 length:969 start_codon:yes stop_codon:yes gene_type:complete